MPTVTSRAAAALVRGGAVAVASLALGACGMLSSPADGLSFKAPDGWKSSPGIMGRFQMWFKQGSNPNDEQFLVLVKLPEHTKLETFDATNVRLGTNTDISKSTVVERKSIRLCGNQPAIYVKMRGQSQNNDTIEEGVVSKAAGATFMALYAYPAQARPEPDAERSIYELCPANA